MREVNLDQVKASLDRRINRWQQLHMGGKNGAVYVRDELNEMRLELFGEKIDVSEKKKPEGSARVIF